MDPEYFTTLAHHIPTSPASTYNSSAAPPHNELTRYRYDTNLSKDRHHPPPPHRHPHPTLDPARGVRRQSRRPEASPRDRTARRLRVTGVPNPRLTEELAVRHAL